MSGPGNGGPGGWPEVPHHEMSAFYETADRFLDAANALVGAEPDARIGAAFLYACARYNAFALQAQLDDQVDEATANELTGFFEQELSDHMTQHLQNAPGLAVGQATGAALDVLVGLNAMDEDARRAFLRLADRFIHIANDQSDAMPLGRVSAACLHACTRFNAFLLQREGLPPGPADPTLVADFKQVYTDLLRFHLGQSLIKPAED